MGEDSQPRPARGRARVPAPRPTGSAPCQVAPAAGSQPPRVPAPSPAPRSPPPGPFPPRPWARGTARAAAPPTGHAVPPAPGDRPPPVRATAAGLPGTARPASVPCGPPAAPQHPVTRPTRVAGSRRAATAAPPPPGRDAGRADRHARPGRLRRRSGRVVRPGPVAGWLGDDSAVRPDAGRRPAGTRRRGPVLGALATPPHRCPTRPASTARHRQAGRPTTTSAAAPACRSATWSPARCSSPTRGDVPTVPASTMKLVTAATVLATRGPAYRIPTRVVAGAEARRGDDGRRRRPDPGGQQRRATTRVRPASTSSPRPRKKALGGTAPTKVDYDSSLYSGPVYEPGWDSDIPTGGFGGAGHRADDQRRPDRAQALANGYAERLRQARRRRRQGVRQGARRAGTPAVAPAGSVPAAAGDTDPGGERQPGSPARSWAGSVAADGPAGRVHAGRQRQRGRRGAGPAGRARQGPAGLVRRRAAPP